MRDIDKEEILNRYIEDPRELDKMLLSILEPEAVELVYEKLPLVLDELELFEVKFALAVYYTFRGFPVPGAPTWEETTRGGVNSRITLEGAKKIIMFIRKLSRERRKRYGRRVDRIFFFQKPEEFI